MTLWNAKFSAKKKERKRLSKKNYMACKQINNIARIHNNTIL